MQRFEQTHLFLPEDELHREQPLPQGSSLDLELRQLKFTSQEQELFRSSGDYINSLHSERLTPEKGQPIFIQGLENNLDQLKTLLQGSKNARQKSFILKWADYIEHILRDFKNKTGPK